ncbi:glycoside hydrolase superfamily [Phakopsora pachyrhizi]|nr:glycoside hydrolase superfamily [Phakopsora pachyrhizi]
MTRTLSSSPSSSSSSSSSITSKSSTSSSPSKLLFLITFFVSLLNPILSIGPALGEVDQIYYGVWVDSDIGYSDTPLLYNSRLQRNASVFHLAQNMPLRPYNYTTGIGGPAPEYLIENTATDAAVFLSVYPDSLTNLTDNDFTTLSHQIMAYQKDFNRTVFLRFAPEMQGRWFPYGQQPVQYVQLWQTMYRSIKSAAPNTIIIWAPNQGYGYPYGQTADITTEDMSVLDTNKNGRLDAGDDPYAPYYPGDDYVDWIGLSIYFKQFSHNINQAQPAGFCSDMITGVDTQNRQQNGVDWYNNFCASKPTKACLVAESGSAYHPNDSGPASQLEIQRAWWQDCITNTTFMERYPRLKLHMHFEFEKPEADNGPLNLRDYRLTNKTEVLQSYQADLNNVQDRYLWATYRPITRPIQTVGPGVSAPASLTATVPTLVLQTQRNPVVTGLPTLFGARHSSSTKKRLDVTGTMMIVGITSLMFIGWEGIGRGRRRALMRRREMGENWKL